MVHFKYIYDFLNLSVILTLVYVYISVNNVFFCTFFMCYRLLLVDHGIHCRRYCSTPVEHTRYIVLSIDQVYMFLVLQYKMHAIDKISLFIFIMLENTFFENKRLWTDIIIATVTVRNVGNV